LGGAAKHEPDLLDALAVVFISQWWWRRFCDGHYPEVFVATLGWLTGGIGHVSSMRCPSAAMWPTARFWPVGQFVPKSGRRQASQLVQADVQGP